MTKKIPNKKDYGFIVLIRRWWKEFTCTHWNGQVRYSADGWNILVCNRCQRAKIFTDNQKPVDIDD